MAPVSPLARRRWAPLAAALSLCACERDPVLLGFWDIEKVEIDLGDAIIEQDDMGTLEFVEGGATLVLRYTLEGGAMSPVAAPRAVLVGASTGDRTGQLGETYLSEGEVSTVVLGLDTYIVDEYGGAHAVLDAEAASPPGEVGDPAVEGALKLPVRWWLLR